MVTTKISATKTSSNILFSRLEKGFTLFEVMIVIGIIAAVLAYGTTRMNLKSGNIKSVVRKLSVVTREVRNQARLKNRTYRLVFSMPEDGKDHPSYWIEYANGPQLAPSQATLEKRAKEEAFASEDKKPKSPFQKDESLLKKPEQLPKDLYIGQVETLREPDPKTTGEAYIYFSPEGLVEKSAVQITNRKTVTWTLILNPLTGHADIVEKAVLLKDVSRE